MPLLVAAALCATGAAAAQTVFRCGPNGNAYSERPCKDGRVVDVSDPRSRSQQDEALRFQRREQALADRLAKDRHAFVKAHPARAPAGIRSVAPPDPSTRPKRARVAGQAKRSNPGKFDQGNEESEFVAVAPGNGGKKRRLAAR